MSIEAPATNPASNLALKLPATIGSANQILKNNGTAGTLEWSTFVEDSSGNVGIGTASPTAKFDVRRDDTDGKIAEFHQSAGYGIDIGSSQSVGYISSGYGQAFVFKTDPSSGQTERMRINSSGDVTVNNSGGLDAYRLAGAGSSLRGVLMMADGRQANTTTQSQLHTLNRLDDDGPLITFSQNGTQEGNISVSGSAISYNGGHLSRWSQLKGLSTTDKSARPTIYQGTVMSNLDDLCVWEGEDNQQLNMTKVSDVVGDKDVAGVFFTWDDADDKVVNDFYIAMTGDMVIRVAASTTVARGDLLISAGDGTAKPQADDIVRSSTIAKIISTNHTATYPDGSKAYPCVLMAC